MIKSSQDPSSLCNKMITGGEKKEDEEMRA